MTLFKNLIILLVSLFILFPSNVSSRSYLTVKQLQEDVKAKAKRDKELNQAFIILDFNIHHIILRPIYYPHRFNFYSPINEHNGFEFILAAIRLIREFANPHKVEEIYFVNCLSTWDNVAWYRKPSKLHVCMPYQLFNNTYEMPDNRNLGKLTSSLIELDE